MIDKMGKTVCEEFIERYGINAYVVWFNKNFQSNMESIQNRIKDLTNQFKTYMEVLNDEIAKTSTKTS